MTDASGALRATERRHSGSTEIDRLDPLALVELFAREDALVPAAVLRAGPAIAQVLSLVEAAFRQGGHLFYVGAGTSGRLGVLDASECPPTFGTAPDMVQGIIAGGAEALVRSIEGAEDDRAAGAAAVDARQIGARDVVIGIAASGATPFVLAALARARAAHACTALLTCATPSADAAALCDVVMQVDVGPELVTGSTRLKAGTATKLVLNILTTGAMIRIGKTWGNLMVDLQATNAKLRDRGERIVMQALPVDRTTAREAVAAAQGRVRTAIVMLHRGVDAAAAESLLAAAGYRLREIIGPPPAMPADGGRHE